MAQSMERVVIDFPMALLMMAISSRMSSRVKESLFFQLDSIGALSIKEEWKVGEFSNGKMAQSMKVSTKTTASMEEEGIYL